MIDLTMRKKWKATYVSLLESDKSDPYRYVWFYVGSKEEAYEIAELHIKDDSDWLELVSVELDND